MRIVTERDVIRDVRDRWDRQYEKYTNEYRLYGGKTVGSIRDALSLLDLEHCSVADVTAAIGTDGWAANKCDECGEHKQVLVHIGDEPDYDARYQELCVECLRAAIEIAALVKSDEK